MTRDTNGTIDNAARTAILMVNGQVAKSNRINWAASLADEVVLFDASALVSILSEQLVDKVRASTRHHFRMLLDRFVADDGHERLHETLLHFLEGRAKRPSAATQLICGDPDQPAPHFNAGSIERALVWGEPELASPMALWSALDRRPVRGMATRCRYLFLAQIGTENDRRGYVVLVQSARRSDHEPYRAWLEHRTPAVLRFEPHVYCDGSFAIGTEIQATIAPRELLMCVVPLDPVVDDADTDLALDRLTGLLCHRLDPDPEGGDLDDVAGDVAGSHEAWLSLTGYSDLFLGDGERKRLLDAHLSKRTGPGRKAQADPDLA